MAITIVGIKLHDLWIGDGDEGVEKVTAHYQLMTSDHKTIGAKESLSSGKGYGENTFVPSPQTIKSLREAAALYRKDVEMSLGLEVV